MKKIIFRLFVLAIVFFCFSCNNYCKSYLENVFRPLDYKMVVTGKYIDTRFYMVIGRDTSGVIDTTEENAIDKDVYGLIEIGDTLFKEKGKLELYLIKRDTTLVFPNFCD